MDELAREVSQKNINWEHVNKLIADMGDSINNLDDHDSMLTYTLKDVKYGQNAAQITKIFIDNGFDVKANDEINGAASLNQLCWLPQLGPYILDVAELLLDAGANCSLELYDHENDEKGTLSSIGSKLAYWTLEYYDDANIYEAYWEMIERAQNNRPYKGIRSFRPCVGKTVTAIEKIGGKKNDQFGFLIIWCGETPLVISKYVDAIIDPYCMNGVSATDKIDLSNEYNQIIGTKIRGLRFLRHNKAHFNFDNNYYLSIENKEDADYENVLYGIGCNNIIQRKER